MDPPALDHIDGEVIVIDSSDENDEEGLLVEIPNQLNPEPVPGARDNDESSSDDGRAEAPDELNISETEEDNSDAEGANLGANEIGSYKRPFHPEKKPMVARLITFRRWMKGS